MHASSRSFIAVSLASLIALACDRAEPPAPAVAASAPSAIASPEPAPAAPATSAPPPVAIATPAAPAAPAIPDCAALAQHVDAVVRATGTPRAKSVLPALAEMQRQCEGDRNDAALTACFMAATDAAGFDACNRQAFPGPIDATSGRKFHALRDNSGVSPPIGTEDGDYIAYDDDCGTLYKEVPPAAALFIACNGKVQIGPLVSADEFDRVMKSLSDQERQRHNLVTSLIKKARVGDFRVPVHVYESNGTYRGIEYH